MPLRFDPARREIAVGTRRLPFRLDLRNDRVSVTLGDAEVAVRPLQWREKLALARFAHLGPDFLRQEVIRLCTVPELPSPLADEEAEVLWELAAWMSEPPTSTPVPLESRSLASVTIRLCRAMGLKPADFDSRSVPEVEAMWEALGQPADHRAEDSLAEDGQVSSGTRIVIVPDGTSGERRPQPPLSPEREAKAASAFTTFRKPVEIAASPDPLAHDTSAAEAPLPDTLAPGVLGADTWSRPAARETRPADAAPEKTSPAEPSLPESSLSESSLSESSLSIARASLTSSPGTPPLAETNAPRIASPRGAAATRSGGGSAPLEASETPARRTPRLVPPAPPVPVRSAPAISGADPSVESAGRGDAVAASQSIGTIAMVRARHLDPLRRPIARVSPPPSRADVAFASMPSLIGTAGAEPLRFAPAASSPHGEQDWIDDAETMGRDIFETLADRLEQAASEMGIGEG